MDDDLRRSRSAPVASVRLIVASAAASFRAATEDRFAVHPLADGLVVVVADGAGGLPGGAAAADAVLGVVRDATRAPGFDAYDAAAWVDRLRAADVAVEAAPACGEATAVVVAVRADGLVVGASCGDSGAVVIAADGLVDELTAHQRRKLRLGGGRAQPVAFARASLDGTLVVATDGLFAFARPADVAEVVRGAPFERAPAALVDRARTPRSGDLVDDVAVVVVRAAAP